MSGVRRAEDIIRSPVRRFAFIPFNTGRFMKQLTFLGSTGSIGYSTHWTWCAAILIASALSRRVVPRRAGILAALCRDGRYVERAERAQNNNFSSMAAAPAVLSGQRAACEDSGMMRVGHVMAAIVGAAVYCRPRRHSRRKTILLAGKIAGDLRAAVYGRSKTQRPAHCVDSEHNAIFQGFAAIYSA